MKIFLSSESPVKHEAVKNAFSSLGVDAETIAVPMSSNVSEQPLSIDETYEGAINRHQQLVAKIGKQVGCYFITIESGIFTPRPEHNFFGTTTLIVDYEDERHVGIDVDIEFPKHMTDRVPAEYKDLGELVKAEYGATTSDPFPYFTNGRLTRSKVIEEALYRVLIQFGSGSTIDGS
jgi:non-canonical (house-cleaning) NTP pyrophosphatase